jgi:PTH1 family peptidyl-tRNA hydrolase
VASLKIVLGLGNPGPEYEGTRHNLGFRVLDRLARKWAVEFSLPQECGRKVWVAAKQFGYETIVLAKPRTYMNRSGRAALALGRQYEVSAGDFLVVCDDADLELGRVRIREAGRAGGHNGLRSLIDVFGSPDFPRIKLGVRGASRDECELADYVLAPFEPEEHDLVERLVERGAHAVRGVLEVGVRAAMNLHNRPDPEVGDKSEAQTEPE